MHIDKAPIEFRRMLNTLPSVAQTYIISQRPDFYKLVPYNNLLLERIAWLHWLTGSMTVQKRTHKFIFVTCFDLLFCPLYIWSEGKLKVKGMKLKEFLKKINAEYYSRFISALIHVSVGTSIHYSDLSDTKRKKISSIVEVSLYPINVVSTALLIGWEPPHCRIAQNAQANTVKGLLM